MITGLNHVTFTVRNLEESLAFYSKTLGLRIVFTRSNGAYLLAGDFWIALIEETETEPVTHSEYSHIAFSVDPANFAALSDRIKLSGAKIWQDNNSEGASLYFLDPNGHKLEIHTSDLSARLQYYRVHGTPDMHFFNDAEVTR